MSECCFTVLIISKWATSRLLLPAGAGKTILASNTINQLSTPSDSSSATVYVYCRYDDNCTAHDFVCSLIRQILEDHPETAYDTIKPLFDEHTRTRAPFPTEKAKSTLTSLLGMFEVRRIIVDGLDEVGVEKERLGILSVLAHLKVQLIIFSRPLSLYLRYLPRVTSLSIEARTEDIERFVISYFESSPDLQCILEGKQGVVNSIAKTIVEKSGGMWVLPSLTRPLSHISLSGFL